jgi:hypothetical protein
MERWVNYQQRVRAPPGAKAGGKGSRSKRIRGKGQRGRTKAKKGIKNQRAKMKRPRKEGKEISWLGW